jgi:aspartate/methionine/tyrosine aminotransferase
MVSERLAAVVMEPGRREAALTRTRGMIRRNLPVLEEWIAAQDGVFDFIRPVAGAIAFLAYDLPIGSSDLVDRIRLEQSVLVVPGDQFGFGKYLRIGFGSDVDYTVKGLERVAETIRQFR